MSPKRHTFPFPPEIQHRIYKLVLEEEQQPTVLKQAHELPLCRVTRQIHSECYSTYLQVNHFLLRGLEPERIWFIHQIKHFPKIHQNLRKITFRFHRQYSFAKKGEVAEYKRYKGTQLILQTLAKCRNLDLTIRCRFDELQDMYSTRMLDEFKSFAFQILHLPSPSQTRGCDYHSQSNMLARREHIKDYLFAWAKWYGELLKYMTAIKPTLKTHMQSTFTIMSADPVKQSCCYCLVELHEKGYVDMPETWPGSAEGTACTGQ